MSRENRLFPEKRTKPRQSGHVCSVAQSGLSKTPAYLSALGAKRTCRDGRWRISQSRLTHSGHEQAAFAAMQGLERFHLREIALHPECVAAEHAEGRSVGAQCADRPPIGILRRHSSMRACWKERSAAK